MSGTSVKRILGSIRRQQKDLYLAARGRVKKSTGGSLPIENLFMGTVQKSGSQWFKSIFSDPRIQAKTGLLTYPQRRYEYTQFKRRFPVGCFVPGLYMSYDLYDEIEKPKNYKTFYVIRDPRDIIVSWYWSMKDTHSLMGKVGKFRATLHSLDFKNGLHYCIDAFHMKLACMRSWALNFDDPRVLPVYFEDIVTRPQAVIQDILNFAAVEAGAAEVAAVTQDYTKRKMRERDLQRRVGGSDSHYRSKASRHTDAFDKDHYEHFYRSTGDLVEVLGYER